MLGMEVYTGFDGYGAVEMLKNLVLDFVEADGDWRGIWAVVEGMA